MNQTTWFDGVPGLTQCPQSTGSSFSYIFKVEQYGTYWYHSHFVAQYVDGLKGPIIVHDPEDPYKDSCDFEYVMTVSDWYHEPTGNFMPTFRDVNYRGNDPVPDSGEISGVGRYDCSKVTDGTPCKDKGYATYVVKKGKRYRFRIINTSAMTHFVMSIDNHPMSVIEIDGINVKNYTANFIPVNIAQRYSVIINCDKDVGNFWIRAIMSRCSIPYQPGDPGTINSNSILNYNVFGILRYEGAPKTNPNSTSFNIPNSNNSNCYDIDLNNLKPYPADPPPKNADYTMSFSVNVVILPSSGMLAAIINGSSFSPDFANPTVMRLQNGEDPSKFQVSDNAYGYNIPSNSVVDIVLINQERRTHPFHMHGHAFWILCQGERGTNGTDPSKLPLNTDDPPKRDVVTLKPLSTTIIRYITDNPGVWAFHCHIEWHVEMGMVLQLIESPDILTKQLLPNMPSSLTDLCKNYDSSTDPLETDNTEDQTSSTESYIPPVDEKPDDSSSKLDTNPADQPSGTVPNDPSKMPLTAPSNYNKFPDHFHFFDDSFDDSFDSFDGESSANKPGKSSANKPGNSSANKSGDNSGKDNKNNH
ncbi:8704_t:CDS:2 [Gigaspora margarita]|uniref:8704_t:CDS:1 n=1 Tax=Gigaspora margarita TaxID=4874 RepID=A0ABN7URS8_GIGMA|nr:8704_t:CDS:2 [Gigaspora margarita]